MDASRPADAQTQLTACAGCPIYQLALVPSGRSSPQGTKPDKSTAGSNAALQQRLAVRHARGITLLHLTVPTLHPTPGHKRRSVQQATLRTRMWQATHAITSAGNIADMLWNPYIPAELLYVCHGGALFSLWLPSNLAQCSTPDNARPQSRSKRRKRAPESIQAQQDVAAGPLSGCKLVAPLQAHIRRELEVGDGPQVQRMSLACASNARRIFMTSGRLLHVAQVRLWS
jgi:hypothetical protein